MPQLTSVVSISFDSDFGPIVQTILVFLTAIISVEGKQVKDDLKTVLEVSREIEPGTSKCKAHEASETDSGH